MPSRKVHEDEEDEFLEAGPITEAVAANITKEHIDKVVDSTTRLIDSWNTRSSAINKTRLHWNYATLLLVSVLLGGLTWVDKVPPEALTGFLGTAVGYWLASANRPTR